MSEMPSTPEDYLALVANRLVMQDNNRLVFLRESGDRELTPVEFVVLAVYEFWRNIHVNGFSGFLSNTNGQFLHFLPIAFAAIGAPLHADLARRAAAGDEKDRPSDPEFWDCPEDPASLLTRYAWEHRGELPDPALGANEAVAKWRADRERWSSERMRGKPELDAVWGSKERTCPDCGTTFTSKFDRGMCPRCRHVFFAHQEG